METGRMPSPFSIEYDMPVTPTARASRSSRPLPGGGQCVAISGGNP
jgi:hypothetical protein